MAVSLVNLILFVCLYNTLSYWGSWRTRNLPHNQGGQYHNVFNDERHFCCIYGTKPCNPLARCYRGTNETQLVQPWELGSPIGPVWRWFAQLVCILLLAFFTKKRDWLLFAVCVTCAWLCVTWLTNPPVVYPDTLYPFPSTDL